MVSFTIMWVIPSTLFILAVIDIPQLYHKRVGPIIEPIGKNPFCYCMDIAFLAAAVIAAVVEMLSIMVSQTRQHRLSAIWTFVSVIVAMFLFNVSNENTFVVFV